MTRRDYAWPEIWIAELLILGAANINVISPLWIASAIATTVVAAALSRLVRGWRLTLAYLTLGCGLAAAPYASTPMLLGLGAIAIAVMSLGRRAKYFRLGVAGTLSPVVAVLLANWQLSAA